MASRKILIGGGSGFIGKRLGELLQVNGYDVTNIVRMPGANNMSWTALEEQGIPRGVFAAVNCAGQQFMDVTKRWSPGFKQNVHNSRVFTTKALATAINKAHDKPRVFVVVTGVGAYEPSDICKYDESSPTTGKDFFSILTQEMERAAYVDPPVRLKICNLIQYGQYSSSGSESLYPITKKRRGPLTSTSRFEYRGRNHVHLLAKVIIRSGVVIGRWGGMIKNMYLPFYLGLGGHIGTGKQYLPWIHIDDLVRLIHFAITNEKVVGILNGVAPQVITNEEFTKSFANAMGRPSYFSIPEALLNMLLNPERAMIVTKGQQVIPKRVIEYGFKYNYQDIDRACKDVAHLLPKRHPLE